MARRPTRARKDDYEHAEYGPPILLWSAATVLFILTALPYLIGNALIELEVLAAQPFLRLILLVLSIAVAALAVLREEIPIAILPAVAALLLVGETFTTMGTSPSAHAPQDRVGYLHVYTQNIGMKSPEEFVGMISSGDFDVVLLQEAYISHSGGWEVLAQQLGYHFYFQILRRDAGMGSLVMSKYPIQPLPSIRAQSWARQIRYFPRVRIRYEESPVDIYNVHLESLPLVQGERLLFGSSKLRLQQAEILAQEITATNHPVILGGRPQLDADLPLQPPAAEPAHRCLDRSRFRLRLHLPQFAALRPYRRGLTQGFSHDLRRSYQSLQQRPPRPARRTAIGPLNLRESRNDFG